MPRLSMKAQSLLAASAASVLLMTASPAHASVIWDGDPALGTKVFGTTLCDSPGSVTVGNWNDGHGSFFRFDKPAGSTSRCEGHNVRMPNGEEYAWENNRTYWFGWDSMTKTGDTGCVFQWKSNGTNAQHSQNYPVLMKVEGGRLKAWYVATGEEWIPIGSTPWSAGEWHSIQLGITTSSSGSGTLNVYKDGVKFASRSNARTWDNLGNKPRWGTYFGTDNTKASIHWVAGPKLGTARADVL
ncbi:MULTISPECIES: heparin lyase I family protein [unclassified Streptomyces]|uniref:heparin lyase I family protein n=1 Tax=unclassified Streptomyces TaxID=2593676 RepID=UPI00081F0CCF|nr:MULTISPECIES: heparin lyase I family protein [unclassified Streptomyces]MYR92243.1 hypothetical protein [Streptomyces sp. SID4937]SCD30113.1 hypothetical protein GA0115243_100626 [Streptomyces sp. ScaeMP-e83]